MTSSCRTGVHDDCKGRCGCLCHEDSSHEAGLGWAAIHGGVLSQQIARRLRLAFDEVRAGRSAPDSITGH